ncbi:unnamed protein product [Parnassius apollo]|uniref:(apollo) hypothetical protein n=1 Tax=Parnassius apollo TaxID=110799 RepID=A0A8S3YAI4_PARAO|nr:unnamed protein product [Parnassius apollo]
MKIKGKVLMIPSKMNYYPCSPIGRRIKIFFLSKLCSDIAELKQQNANIQSTNIEMEKALTFISTQYEDMNTKIIILERERKKNYNYILSMENRLEDVQKKA